MQSVLFLCVLLLAFFRQAIAVPSSSQKCPPESNVKHTFYGFPNNTPAGAKIAYSCGRSLAGGKFIRMPTVDGQCSHCLSIGTGTFGDPVTFAAASNGPFKRCEVIYVPYLRKYAWFEDVCGQCSTSLFLSRNSYLAFKVKRKILPL